MSSVPLRNRPGPDVSDNRRGKGTRDRPGAGEPARGDGRVPPHNLEAETALLGAAMLAPAALDVLVKNTRPEDFYRPSHGHIAAAMWELYEEDPGRSADPILVAELLRRHGLLETVVDPRELLAIQAATPATSNAARYAGIVHDLATLRRLIGTAGEIAEHGYARPDDVHDAVTRAQAMVADVAANNGSRSYSSLDFGDVAALLAGDLPTIETDFLTRSDGQSLLYAGRMHMIHGEPTAGKTFIALLAALEILRMGGAVVYLDYEDSLAGIVGRLLSLGADPADVGARFHYVKQDGPFGAPEKLELAALLRSANPDLVIIDSIGEALSRDGLKEDQASDVITWIEKLPRWITRTGAAALILDHVKKDRESRGRWSRGSGAKLGAIDGSAFEAITVSGFSRHKAGRVDLKVAKDRHGTFELGAIAATINVTPYADGERLVLELVPHEVVRSTDVFRPTATMRRISEEIERARVPVSAKSVRLLVPGAKPKTVAEALARLISEGWVTTYRNGSTELLRVIRPFTEDETAPGAPPPAEPPPDLFDGYVVEGPWSSDYERDKALFDEPPEDPDNEGDE